MFAPLRPIFVNFKEIQLAYFPIYWSVYPNIMEYVC